MAQTADTPIEAHRSSEGRFLLVWLPASLVLAVLLALEVLGHAYYALATLPLLPVCLAVLFLRRHPAGSLRSIVVFLVPYLLLEWVAEIYYVGYWSKHAGSDPAVPSVADYCWLASYLFLTVGCWRFAFGRRGLPVQSRDAFAYGAWLAIAAGIVTWMAIAVSRTHTATEALVLGLYPFFDAVIISLLLIIRSRHRADMLRPFWTMLIFACLAVLGGDVMWLLSKVDPGNEELLMRFGDGGFIHAYLLFTGAIWVGFQLERLHVGGANPHQTEVRLRRELSAGGAFTLTLIPAVVPYGIHVLTEKGLLTIVSPIIGVGAPTMLAGAAISMLLMAGVSAWERRKERISLYRDEFLRRLRDGVDQTADDTAFFERLRVALHVSPRDARAIEGRVLREREDELRARLELLQQRSSERRSAEEWATAKSAWLGSIRELNLQIESQAGAGTARSGDDRPHG
jgi:hypothetical protein